VALCLRISNLFLPLPTTLSPPLPYSLFALPWLPLAYSARYHRMLYATLHCRSAYGSAVVSSVCLERRYAFACTVSRYGSSLRWTNAFAPSFHRWQRRTRAGALRCFHISPGGGGVLPPFSPLTAHGTFASRTGGAGAAAQRTRHATRHTLQLADACYPAAPAPLPVMTFLQERMPAGSSAAWWWL